ncbi:MAG: cytochrome c biogenesis protein CcdA [Candidatus Tectomicrobia bacterium]
MVSFATIEALTREASLLAFGVSFVAGLLTAFSPVFVPMLSAVLGYVGGSGTLSRGQGLKLSLALATGIVVVDMVIGGLFASGGAIATRFISANLALWNLLAGVLLGLLGLCMLGLLAVRLPLPLPRIRAVKTAGGAFALGLPFGLVTCPSCTPLMLPVAVGAAATGNVWYGAGLLGVFGLGLSVPLVSIGVSLERLQHCQSVVRVLPMIQRLAALLVLGTSGYFFWQFTRLF